MADDVFLVTITQKTELINGFLPMRYALTNLARFQINDAYEKLSVDNQVLAVKTDCLYAIIKDGNCIKQRIGPYFGQYKILKGSLPPNNEIVQYKTKQIITYPEQDIRIVDKVLPKTIIDGFAGCGKSYAAQDYVYKPLGENKKQRFEDKEILVVCPYNSQVNNVLTKSREDGHDIQACTFHNLIGLNFEGEYGKNNAFSLDDIKAIIFEEVMLMTRRHMNEMNKFMHKHPHICFIANGDSHQLESIDDDATIEMKCDYVQKIFDNKYTLTFNHRLKTQQDRDDMLLIQDDLFDETKDLQETIRKWFGDRILSSLEDVSKLKINRAISYLVYSSKVLNTFIDERLDKSKKRKAAQCYTLADGKTYHFGQELVCKTNITRSYKYKDDGEEKTATTKLRPNQRYTIIGQTKKEFKLQDISSEHIKIDITHDMICKWFELSHCNTCHSEQGSCIAEKFVITDLLTITDRRWVYSAVSRCSKLSDVHFLQMDLTDMRLDEYFKDKIQDYKKQDRSKKRDYDYMSEEYVDVEWCKEQYIKNNVCIGCHGHMKVEKSSKVQCTVDRIDNGFAHFKWNCRLMCNKCNTGKK